MAAARARNGGGRRRDHRDGLAATALRSDETTPAQPGPQLVADTQLVSAGGSMASGFGAVWVADIASGGACSASIPAPARSRRGSRSAARRGSTRPPARSGRSAATGCCGSIRRATGSCQHRRAPRRPPAMILEGGGAVWIAYPTRSCASTCGATWSRAPCRPRARAYIQRRSRVGRADPLPRAAATAGCCASTRAAARSCRPSARPCSPGRRRAVGTLLGVADGTVFMVGKSGVIGGRRRHRPQALDSRPPRGRG